MNPHIKFLYLLITTAILLISINAQTTSISIPYSNPSLFTSETNNKSFFIVSFPEQYGCIKIKTSPKDPQNQINIFISYVNSEPQYTNSDYKTFSHGDNVLFIPYNAQYKSFYMTIYSTDPNTEYSLNITSSLSTIPNIEMYEETNFLPSKWTQFHMNYTRDNDLGEHKQYVVIYALGQSISEFDVNLKHQCVSEEPTNEQMTRIFYNGKAVLLNLFPSQYKGGNECWFVIEFTYEQDNIIKLGVANPSLFGDKETIDLRNMKTYYTILPSFYKPCFALNNLPSIDGQNDQYIFTVRTYPYNTISVTLKNDPSSNSDIASYYNSGETSTNDYILQITTETKYLCFKNVDIYMINEVGISFSLIKYDLYDKYQIYREPLINGIIHKIRVPNKSISVFRRGRFINGNNNNNIFLKKISHNSTLHGYNCVEFPCIISNQTLPELNANYSLIHVNAINEDYHLFKRYPTEVNPDSPNKFLSIVICEDEIRDCEFYISVVLDGVDDVLIEKDIEYTVTLTQNVKQQNFIYNNDNSTISSLAFELYSITGNAQMEIQTNGVLKESHKYIGNKEIIVYENNADSLQQIDGIFYVTITSNVHSYVSLRVIQNYAKENITHLTPGLIMMEAVTPKNPTRRFSVLNRKYNEYIETPYIITVNPLNCAVNFTFLNTTMALVASNNYLIEPIDLLVTNKTFEFQVTYSINKDIYKPLTENEFCMFYVSGTEAQQSRPLLLNEANEFIGLFYKDLLDLATFHYPFVFSFDENRVIIIISLEGTHNLTLTVNFNSTGYLPSKTFNIYQETSIVLDSADLIYCAQGIVCNLILDLKVNSFVEDLFEYKIRVTGSKKVPTYLRKGKVVKDITPQNSYHYFYSEIPASTEGEIYINYIRGSGFASARIVRKNLTEENADWNNHLILPYIDMPNTLKYDYNTGIIIYKKEDTQHCEEGCEVYIAVYNNYVSSNITSLEYSISTRELNMDYQDNGFTIMEEDVYIFGAFDNNEKYDYYLLDISDSKEDIKILTQGSPFVETYVTFGVDYNVSSSNYLWSSEGNNIITITMSSLRNINQYTSAIFSIAVKMSKIPENGRSEKYLIKAFHGYKNSNFNFISQQNGEICKFDRISRCHLALHIKYYENVQSVYLTIQNYDISNSNIQYTIYAIVLTETEYFSHSKLPINLIPSKTNYHYTSLTQHRRDSIYIPISPEFQTNTTNAIILFTIMSSGEGLAKVYASTKEEQTLLTLNLINTELIYLKNTTKSKILYFDVSNKNNCNNVNFNVLYGSGIVKYENGNNKEVILSKGKTSIDMQKKTTNEQHLFNIESINDELLLLVNINNGDTCDVDKFKQFDYAFDNKYLYNITNKEVPFPHYYYMQYPIGIKSLNLEFKVRNHKLVNDNSNKENNFNIITYTATEDFFYNKKYIHSLLPTEQKTEIILFKYNEHTHKGYANINLNENNSYLFVELNKKNSISRSQSIHYELSAYPSIFIGNINGYISQYKYHHFELNTNNEYLNILKLSQDNNYKSNDTCYYYIEFSSCGYENEIALSFRNYSETLSDEDLEIYQNDTALNIIEDNYLYGKHIIKVSIKQYNPIAMVISLKHSNSNDNKVNYIMKYFINDNNDDKELYINEFKSSNIKYTTTKNELNLYTLQANVTFNIQPLQYTALIFQLVNEKNYSKVNASCICSKENAIVNETYIDIANANKNGSIEVSLGKDMQLNAEDVYYASVVLYMYDEVSNKEVMLMYDLGVIKGNEKKKVLTYVIIGISLGCVLVLMLVCYLKNKSNKKRKSRKYDDDNAKDASLIKIGPILSINENN